MIRFFFKIARINGFALRKAILDGVFFVFAGIRMPNHPASTERVHLKYDRDNIVAFVKELRDIPPEQR